MNELQKIFNYGKTQLRTIIKGENIWFVAKDVCGILKIKNVSDAISKLNEKFKTTIALTDTGSNYKTNALIVNEAGLYKLIFKSRKEEAERFSDWVAEEVLPSIRKHGAYMTENTIEKALTNPDFLIQIATKLKEEQELRKQAEQKVIEQQPKVIFADAVSASQTSVLISDLAKILKQNGYETGQKRLFERLRNEGYLIKRKGADYNSPTQRSMELKLFEVKETAITHSDGHVSISKTTKVTGKGQLYFINKYLEKVG